MDIIILGEKMKIPTACLSILLLSSASCSYAMHAQAQAHAFNSKGMVDHNTPFHTSHTAVFINDSNDDQTVNVMYKACAQFQDCDEKRFSVVVKAHTTFQDTMEFRKIYVYKRLGKYKCSAETVITGPIYGREFSQAKLEIEDR